MAGGMDEKVIAKMKPTKLEKAIIEAIKTAKLGLPEWSSVAKQ